MCCAFKENVVPSPYSLFEGEDLFHGLLISYSAFLVLWVFSIIMYINCKKTLRVASYEVNDSSIIQVRQRADTVVNPLGNS